jgi:uncharacterized protein (DUF1697 family)
MKETKAESKKTEIQIDNETFFLEDMTDEQKTLVNHVADLDRKIASSKFNLDQLSIGRDAFVSLLKQALEPKEQDKPE